jgi:hypothetical protein
MTLLPTSDLRPPTSDLPTPRFRVPDAPVSFDDAAPKRPLFGREGGPACGSTTVNAVAPVDDARWVTRPSWPAMTARASGSASPRPPRLMSKSEEAETGSPSSPPETTRRTAGTGLSSSVPPTCTVPPVPAARDAARTSATSAAARRGRSTCSTTFGSAAVSTSGCSGVRDAPFTASSTSVCSGSGRRSSLSSPVSSRTSSLSSSMSVWRAVHAPAARSTRVRWRSDRDEASRASSFR